MNPTIIGAVYKRWVFERAELSRREKEKNYGEF
jgi:hypothetical protein